MRTWKPQTGLSTVFKKFVYGINSNSSFFLNKKETLDREPKINHGQCQTITLTMLNILLVVDIRPQLHH